MPWNCYLEVIMLLAATNLKYFIDWVLILIDSKFIIISNSKEYFKELVYLKHYSANLDKKEGKFAELSTCSTKPIA